MKVFFATSNKHKIREANDICREYGVELVQKKIPYEEIRSTSLGDVAIAGVREVYGKLKKPVIVEDSGIFIKALGDFPGPYSKFVFERIGNRGILDLLGKRRSARFISAIGYTDGKIVKTFEGVVRGKISLKPKGSSGFGYDPIFVPAGHEMTFAQDPGLKATVSHRKKSTERFCKWFISGKR